MVALADIRSRRDEILRLALAHGAHRVRVFGSVARHAAGEGSDLDLLVEMAPDRSLLDRIALIHDLRDLLGQEVDVVNERALHRDIRAGVLAEAVDL
jgi:predicted nucleotidyltransferase